MQYGSQFYKTIGTQALFDAGGKSIYFVIFSSDIVFGVQVRERWKGTVLYLSYNSNIVTDRMF